MHGVKDSDVSRVHEVYNEWLGLETDNFPLKFLLLFKLQFGF